MIMKTKEESKQVKLIYSDGCVSIVNNEDSLFAQHLKRKKITFEKITVKL